VISRPTSYLAATVVAATLLAAVPPAPAQVPWTLDLEAAMVTATSNDVGIPGDTGTRFSLTDDLSTDDDVAFRVRLGRRLGERHHLSALYAPLQLSAAGAPGFAIDFNGETFAAGRELDATWTFNSYRLTWRYDLARGERVVFGLGLTAKIRDAYIELSDGQTTTRKDDLGFVPLLHLRLDWRWGDKLGLLLEGDALASPGGEGRAEDVLLALTVRPWERGTFRLGYRILEGGADVDEVYNFALLQYAVFGWSQRF